MRFLKNRLFLAFSLLVAIPVAIAACSSDPEIVEKIVEVEKVVEVEKEVQRLNNEFSNPEQIKKFIILPRDFTIDDGELTPTLKIRRKQINENWSAEINSMYSE